MKGSTLIETLIYIALLGLLFSGVVSSVFILMKQGTSDNQSSFTTSLLQKYHE